VSWCCVPSEGAGQNRHSQGGTGSSEVLQTGYCSGIVTHRESSNGFWFHAAVPLNTKAGEELWSHHFNHADGFSFHVAVPLNAKAGAELWSQPRPLLLLQALQSDKCLISDFTKQLRSSGLNRDLYFSCMRFKATNV
jgi:hypothetical protein